MSMAQWARELLVSRVVMLALGVAVPPAEAMVLTSEGLVSLEVRAALRRQWRPHDPVRPVLCVRAY